MKFITSITFNRAFTLVELMVVVAIIGILTAIVTANFGQARATSRDEIRKTAVKDLELAIKLYRAQEGRYPLQGCGTPGTTWASPTGGSFSGAHCGSADYISGLTPDFIAELPKDPNSESGNNGFLYRTNADGSEFKLMVFNTVEIKTAASGDEYGRCPNFSSCGGASGDRPKTYAVYSAGAANW